MNETHKGNGALEADGAVVKVLRAGAIPAIVAIAIGLFQAGGTLTDIKSIGTTNCIALHQTQAALHREHAHDRFAAAFPPPVGGCKK